MEKIKHAMIKLLYLSNIDLEIYSVEGARRKTSTNSKPYPRKHRKYIIPDQQIKKGKTYPLPPPSQQQKLQESTNSVHGYCSRQWS